MQTQSIRRHSPDAYQQALDHCALSAPYEFLDERHIFLTLTYAVADESPWGYEVQVGKYFLVREQCNYDSRAEAEQAGFEQAFRELNKLILKGNS